VIAAARVLAVGAYFLLAPGLATNPLAIIAALQ
jgi:hypothetical protein